MSGEYHYEDEAQEKAYDAHLMKRLLRYVRPHARMMTLATVLLLFATALGTAMPYVIMLAIDHYLEQPDRAALLEQAKTASPAEQAVLTQQWEERVSNDKHGLAVLMASLVGLILAEMILRYFQMLLVTIVGQQTMLDMRMDVFDRFQRLSLRYIDKHPIGRLMTRVTNDVENIQQTIVTGLVQIIGDLAMVLFAFGFMLYLNPRLALVILFTIPLVFLVSFVFRFFARRSYLEIRRKLARLNAHLQESISGARVVQLFQSQTRDFNEFEQRNAEHRDEWYRQVHYFAIYFPSVDFLGALSAALIILFGGRQILAIQALTGGAATIGLLNAYVQWADRMFTPIRALADKYNLLQAAMASAERIFEILDTPDDVPNRPDAKPCKNIEGHIAFNQVSFAYEPDLPVLHKVSFSIQPGERVAVVGYTGAGKSTMASLLMRFHDVTEGNITLDGVDLRDYDKNTIPDALGIVLQDVYLFSGSIEDNIRMGDESIPFERIQACAEYVNASRFIERLPGGFNYDVGERGGNLSSGQRQLLAFARTLVRDPRILLLDEATSSVDTETEVLIQDATNRLMQGRTSIVIAHRLSTIQNADRILVLHHGELRETGTHAELLAQKGIYHTLYQLQYKEAFLKTGLS